MKTLFIVDVQKDFYSPDGSLYVNGGEKVVEKIEELIRTDTSINQIVFTVDWHTPEDHSFKENGGPWPMHCVQFTPGAAIAPELIEAAISRGFKSIDGKYDGDDLSRAFLCDTYDVFMKGDVPDQEEYGAFCNCGNEVDGIISLSGYSEDSMCYVNPDNDIVVCGLAGDYCVKETIKNLLDIPELKGQFMVYEAGVASIDDGSNLKNFMSENNIAAYV